MFVVSVFTAAMCLALTSKRFLAIFRKFLNGIHISNRYRFGVGTDGNLRCLVSVVGDNLDWLKIDDSKYVAHQTVRALIRYCPNLRVLELNRTPSVCQYDLAEAIQSCCRTLETVSLRDGVFAGDDVLLALGKHCRSLRVLRLQGSECEISPEALACALARCAGTLRVVFLENIFGRGLSLQAVLPPWGMSPSHACPVLENFVLRNVQWLNGKDAHTLCKALVAHAPELTKLLLVLSSRDISVDAMTEEQIAELEIVTPSPFIRRVERIADEPIVRMMYGFEPEDAEDSDEDAQEELLGFGQAGPA